NLQRQAIRLLLDSSGAISDRQGTRTGWPVRAGMGAGRGSRGRKLLFQTEPAQRVAASLHRQSQGRGNSRFSPDRIAQRDRADQRRPLYLATEVAARLGNRAAVR